ncbi:MAG: ABC transporter substrate-binding protein [Cytophagaceae bacterium]|nr:ABC transporter substrate-binding protein [Gemmatimonadaceae bacterium]
MRIILLVALLAATLPVHAQTLRFAIAADAATLDPHAVNLLTTTRLTASVYESLVARDKDFNIVPGLAISWTQPDPLTWRFTLRPGVKFHEGEAFTADDVVFSIERTLHPLSQLKSSVEGVERAVRVDDLTVDLKMKQPNPVLLLHLFQLRIMSRAWAARHNALTPQNFNDKEDTYAARNTNGTGPYKVVLRQPDLKTVLQEHAQWWNRSSPERGNVKEIVWTPISSNGTRVAALLSGEVDFVIDPPVQDVESLKSNARIRIVEGREARVVYLGFDVHRDELLYGTKGKNPFKDPRVRQAVAHAVDVDLVRDKVYRGYSNPTFSISAPGVRGYSRELDARPKVDRALARKLLAQAGYPDGFDVTLDCVNVVPTAHLCQAIPPMLAQVGIRVTPNLLPTPNFNPKIQALDTSMWLQSWGAVTHDSLYVLQSLLYTRQETKGALGDYNLGRWTNSEFDSLVDRVRVETDLAKRDRLIHDALAIVARDVPIVPLTQNIIPWAMRSNVQAASAPNNIPYFFRFRIS